VNDLSHGVNQFANPVICADDTSVLVSAKNLEDLKSKVDFTLHYITDWFSFNGLTLNMDKINIIKFSSNHSQNQPHQCDSVNYSIKEVTNINFLGLELDNHKNWKNHDIKILPKLSRACYAVRAMYPIRCMNMLKMIYFAYFHSIIHYGIIFGGNSTECKKVFLAQKKIIRITTGSRPRTSCKPLFQSLRILTVPSQYILSLMNFVLQNQERFTPNIEVHNFNTTN